MVAEFLNEKKETKYGSLSNGPYPPEAQLRIIAIPLARQLGFSVVRGMCSIKSTLTD